MKIIAAKSILKANDQLAAANRRRFDDCGAYVVNLVGSPGCGKTTLLEALIRDFRSELRPSVIEGDVAGQLDAERMQGIGVPVVQIDTEGMCHLDANMISNAVAETGAGNATLFIENIGNLVCTAGYDLGEHVRVVVLSVPEGDDKLVKYPAIFQRSDALVVSKLDLLEACEFSVERVRDDMRRLAPQATVFEVSAKTRAGIAEFGRWLVAQRANTGVAH